MIHPICQRVQPDQMLNAKQFQDLADGCNIQTHSIAVIIASATGQKVEQVFADMNQTRFFNAEQSLSYGLVTKVVTNFFPAGTTYTVVDEDGTVTPFGPAPRAITKAIDTLKMPPSSSIKISGQG